MTEYIWPALPTDTNAFPANIDSVRDSLMLAPLTMYDFEIASFTVKKSFEKKDMPKLDAFARTFGMQLKHHTD
jgi:hypothetical protein